MCRVWATCDSIVSTWYVVSPSLFQIINRCSTHLRCLTLFTHKIMLVFGHDNLYTYNSDAIEGSHLRWDNLIHIPFGPSFEFDTTFKSQDKWFKASYVGCNSFHEVPTISFSNLNDLHHLPMLGFTDFGFSTWASTPFAMHSPMTLILVSLRRKA